MSMENPDCETCGGSGMILGTIVVNGEKEEFQERCPECEAYEEIMNEVINKQ